MGKCLKGKSEVEKKDARFRCRKCDALAGKKGHVCDPKKVDPDRKKKKGKDGKKKKEAG